MARPLAGYPVALGDKYFSVFPHLGPASYTQVTAVAGTVPILGGDIVTGLPEAGFPFIDTLSDASSDDGAFVVEPISTTVSNPSSIVTSALSGIPAKTWRLRWISRVTATVGGQAQTAGQEAVAGTNLSAECVRLQAWGN